MAGDGCGAKVTFDPRDPTKAFSAVPDGTVPYGISKYGGNVHIWQKLLNMLLTVK